MLTQERLEAFDEASTAELARRLEEDDYPSPFDSLSTGTCCERWRFTAQN